MTDEPDMAAAARGFAASELIDATRLTLAQLPDDFPKRSAPDVLAMREALRSHGVDLDDADQAAMVAAVMHVLASSRHETQVACAIVSLAACSALDAAYRS